MVALREGYTETKARVEELEADCALKDDIIQGCGHVLTNEMIDAAWTAAYGSESSLSILRLLNIHRCEGCGGSCWSKEEHQSPCPTCHGHGWTIGDQK